MEDAVGMARGMLPPARVTLVAGEEKSLMDLVCMLVVLVLFAASLGLIALCERL